MQQRFVFPPEVRNFRFHVRSIRLYEDILEYRVANHNGDNFLGLVVREAADHYAASAIMAHANHGHWGEHDAQPFYRLPHRSVVVGVSKTVKPTLLFSVAGGARRRRGEPRLARVKELMQAMLQGCGNRRISQYDLAFDQLVDGIAAGIVAGRGWYTPQKANPREAQVSPWACQPIAERANAAMGDSELIVSRASGG